MKDSQISDHHFRQGVLSILAASVLWSFVYFFRKTALYGISPPLFSFANAAIGAVGLWVLCRINLRETWKLFCLAPVRFSLLGLTGVTIGTTLMTVGLDHLDLSVALVLEKLQPIFTWILAALFLKERIRLPQIPWVLIALAGSYFVSAKDPWALHLEKGDAIGIAAVLGAALSWGFSSVLGRALIQLNQDFRQTTFIRFVLGAIMLLPFVLTSSSLGLRFKPDPYIVLVIVGSAIFGSAAGYVLFYRGLRFVSASVSGFLELLTPVVGVLLGVVFLREHLSVIQVIAIPTMLYSVYRLTRA